MEQKVKDTSNVGHNDENVNSPALRVIPPVKQQSGGNERAVERYVCLYKICKAP